MIQKQNNDEVGVKMRPKQQRR